MFYQLGLIGFPLGHSLSPKLHAAALRASNLEGIYRLYPVAPEDPPALKELLGKLRQGGINGLNVTIPHKQAVLSLVDELTPSAQAIGAVNTVFLKEGRLVGHNTDAPGFLADLSKLLVKNPAQKIALVLGAGGAARAVVYALLSSGWKVTLAIRRADVLQATRLIDSFQSLEGAGSLRFVLLDASDLSRLDESPQLIVNATPMGMSPETDITPWPEGLLFPQDASVYDVIYNPRQTRLILDAHAAGLQAMTGLGMLVEQAALSFACWTGRVVPREVMAAAVEA